MSLILALSGLLLAGCSGSAGWVGAKAAAVEKPISGNTGGAAAAKKESAASSGEKAGEARRGRTASQGPEPEARQYKTADGGAKWAALSCDVRWRRGI